MKEEKQELLTELATKMGTTVEYL